MRKIKYFFSYILCITMFIFFTSCKNDESGFTREIYALNTVITITAYGENAEAGVNEASDEINRLERLFSVTEPESDISKINSSAGNYTEVSDETADLILRSIEISKLTFGAFDISVYPVVSLWGFTTGEYHVPMEDEIKSLLTSVDYKKISVNGNCVRIEKGMALDLGAIAKGYISGKVIEILRKSGVTSAIVNLGGNVQTLGFHINGSQWKIGVKSPENSGNFAIVTCGESALITSGGYQRNFTENGVTYHHIIDPATGFPANSGVLSVTIISNDATLCDALSTAFYVLGVKKSIEISDKFDIDYIILTDDNKIYLSEDISKSLTINDNSLIPFVQNSDKR